MHSERQRFWGGTLNGTMPRIVRREWACSFRLRQQLFPDRKYQNGLVFMNVPPNLKKRFPGGGFADGMSKPIPYSFDQPDTPLALARGIFLPQEECYVKQSGKTGGFVTNCNQIFPAEHPRQRKNREVTKILIIEK